MQWFSSFAALFLTLYGQTSGIWAIFAITAVSGRSGKPNRRCHQPNQLGYGPNFRLIRKVGKNTVSETFSPPAELRRAQIEVDTYDRFRQLSIELLAGNERICMVRPVENSLPEGNNTAAFIHQEITGEVAHLLHVVFRVASN